MRAPKKIGLVTYRELPQLTASDRLFIPRFAERKIKAETLVWTDPELYFDHCPDARDSFVEATMELRRSFRASMRAAIRK